MTICCVAPLQNVVHVGMWEKKFSFTENVFFGFEEKSKIFLLGFFANFGDGKQNGLKFFKFFFHRSENSLWRFMSEVQISACLCGFRMF